jgi:DNA end-binding protein Ku
VQLKKLVDAKLEAGESVDTAATFGEAAEEEGEGAEVVDLMEALKRSVAESKSKAKSGARSTSTSKTASKPKSRSKSQKAG